MRLIQVLIRLSQGSLTPGVRLSPKIFSNLPMILKYTKDFLTSLNVDTKDSVHIRRAKDSSSLKS